MAAEQLPIAASLGATARTAETTQSPTSTTGVTNMEQALGELINIMNPTPIPDVWPLTRVGECSLQPVRRDKRLRAMPQGGSARSP
jgi:hypothetical protein